MTISVAKIVDVGQGFQLGGKAEPRWAEGSGVYHHFRRRAAHGPNIVRFKGCEGTALIDRLGTMVSAKLKIYGRVRYAANVPERYSLAPLFRDGAETWNEGLFLVGSVEPNRLKRFEGQIRYRHRNLTDGLSNHQLLARLGYRF